MVMARSVTIISQLSTIAHQERAEIKLGHEPGCVADVRF